MRLLSAIVISLVFLTIFAGAQAIEKKVDTPNPGTSADDVLQKRVEQLEEQLAAIKIELARIKEQAKPAEKNTSAIKPAERPDEKTSAVSTAIKTENRAQTDQKQLGIDLGSVRLTPYGTLFFNAFSNSGAVNNNDVPLFAAASGQGGTSASARQTRLGLRFEGARLGTARVGGVIEADFFGGFPTVGIGENFGVVRVRSAFVKLDWERTSLTLGQDWMPFAPVNPASLAAAAIPQLAAAGNNWARIPQIRVDHKIGNHLTITGAILAPQTGDHPSGSTFFLQPNSGAISRTPFLQSRIAFADKDWLGTKKLGTIGVSAHYGQSKIPLGTTSAGSEVESVGIALDWNIPLHRRVGLSGEGFFGRNLGGFQAGIFQGVNTEFAYRDGSTIRPAGARAIGTKGGWAQIGFTPDLFKDRWTLYASVGLDDPHDQDLTSVSRFNFRSRNLALAFNTIYKVTPQLSFGAEYRRFVTQYFVTGRRTSQHINLAAAYSF
ncbi:MAG: hypothetical protein ABL952_08845 [Pyrinomonadaceae bacterium]